MATTPNPQNESFTLSQLLEVDRTRSLTVESVKTAISSARIIPITFWDVPEGTHVFRARAHSADLRYHFPRDVSYRTDLHNIPMGRAHNAGRSIFYGSISSELLKDALLTVCMETSKLMRDKEKGHQTFTVGVWKVKKSFRVPILHHPIARDNNPLHEFSRDELDEMIERLTITQQAREEVRTLRALLAREFSKRVKSDEPAGSYTMTAAFAELLYDKGAAGLAYPSVETEGNGQNIALTPMTMETYLRPAGGQFVQFRRTAEKDYALCQYEMAFGKDVPWRWVGMHSKYSMGMDFLEDVQQ